MNSFDDAPTPARGLASPPRDPGDVRLSQREQLGLRDLIRYAGRPYFWMPKTMKSLEAKGLAEEYVASSYGKAQTGWRITDLGRARATQDGGR